ncbi:MAG: SUMF1/EgtB/PvdO family nonheme iron enzyme [Candidatus Pacebacteria bacterium]|nr:SUMF1/EgtB/PvdO family nonheme iron enzyme [Candidatus Paceibacterota bacterium]
MKFLRAIAVILGALILTTLGINAFDNLDTPGESLLGAAFSAYASKCPKGMVYVGASTGGFCIDAYEASAGGSCAHSEPQSKRDTDDNLSIRSCEPVSVPDEMPWRNITRQQAEFACARVGKRLPTNAEWYRASLGTPDADAWGREDCNVDSLDTDGPDKAGARESCVSPSGAYDLIGNVWEWMQETVQDGTYAGRALPLEGYIRSIDESGIPIETNEYESDESLFHDYFWLDPTEARGMLRGGYWKSRTDAGQYAVNVTVPPTFVGSAVGFRCVKDVE